MRFYVLTIFLLAASPLALSGQQTESLPTNVSVTDGKTWKQLAVNVLDDQKRVIGYPVRLFRHGDGWKPALAITALTASLIALDTHDTPHFRRTDAFDEFNEIASATNSAAFMIAVPVAYYSWSARTQNSYGKQTAFLAVEAMADAQIASVGLQMITRRLRPADITPYGNYSDTWFNANALARKSFPSGHAITAFALADVFSERYARHRWVPWVCYGLAGTIAFSRVTTQGHFPSDVFAGAALGTVVSHYLVLHHHAKQN
jgi:membrane-associated phospholipid phosphatase